MHKPSKSLPITIEIMFGIKVGITAIIVNKSTKIKLSLLPSLLAILPLTKAPIAAPIAITDITILILIALYFLSNQPS